MVSNPEQSESSGNILIVDDTPENLRLLAGILKKRGYEIIPAQDGETAISVALSSPPDLILLDVMMPDMDGYEVCQRLKAEPQTQEIPIIFITALDNIEDKVKGFAVGGIDYITKPFEAKEVLIRVKTHLTLKRTRQQLREQIAELDAFAHTVAHNIKGPLGVVSGYADLLSEILAPTVDDEIVEHLEAMQRNTTKVVNIVNALLLLASVRKTEVEVSPLDMGAIVKQAIQRLNPMVESCQAEISLPDTWPVALGYGPWIEEVWANYLSNGLKYGGDPPRLELGATPQTGGMIRFWVRDNGAGLTAEEQEILFTEFTRLKKVQAEGYGLGLSIVQRIVNKLNGRVGVESKVGQGSTFYFTLPAAAPPDQA